MTRSSPDIVERLRVWPAAYGEDAFSSTYAGWLMKSAADEIERLRDDSAVHSSAGIESTSAVWIGWHPEKGYAPQTCGHNHQHATSLLMRTRIAGEQGWSVRPLYAGVAQATREFPYQQTFDAIASAVSLYPDKHDPSGISISVRKFQEAFNSHRDAKASAISSTQNSPPLVRASQNIAERDPSVMPDSGGGEAHD